MNNVGFIDSDDIAMINDENESLNGSFLDIDGNLVDINELTDVIN